VRPFSEHPELAAPARNVGFTLVCVAILVYGLLALSGPHGVRALMDKHHEIENLTEQVVVLQQENKLIEEKITRLQSDRDEQGLEIRKQRKLVRPGEKTFIIQDARPAVHP